MLFRIVKIIAINGKNQFWAEYNAVKILVNYDECFFILLILKGRSLY